MANQEYLDALELYKKVTEALESLTDHLEGMDLKRFAQYYSLLIKDIKNDALELKEWY